MVVQGRLRNHSSFPASSSEGCCQICGEMPGCVAGVFVGQGFWNQGTCFLKDVQDMLHPRNASKPDAQGKGTTACTPRHATAGSLSIPASNSQLITPPPLFFWGGGGGGGGATSISPYFSPK